MTPQQFVQKFLPYALEASRLTGIDYGVILAQWALETGTGGNSPLWSRGYNLAGIKYSAKAPGPKFIRNDGTESSFRQYANYKEFVLDYARVMRLSYYVEVRAAQGVTATAYALGKSPYSEGHYRNKQSEPEGIKLLMHYERLRPYLPPAYETLDGK